MKKHFKPNTWLYPQPVLVCDCFLWRGRHGGRDGGCLGRNL